MATVGEIVRKTTEFFQGKSPSPRLDSELLIAKALGWDRMQVFMKHDQPLSEEQLEKCRGFVRRRSKGEPVAYILGEKGFYNHTFEVTSATLIPRPETEMLVVRGLEVLESRLAPKSARVKSAVQLEIAAAAAKREEAERVAMMAEAAHMGLNADDVAQAMRANGEMARTAESGSLESAIGSAMSRASGGKPRITIVDLGAGSGCIGLSIAAEIQNRAELRLVFVDISSEALQVAKRNAARLGLDSVSEFIEGDAGDAKFLEGRVGDLLGEVDLVVANPPYIDPADTRVEEGVRGFEPHSALFAGGAGEAGILEIRRWSTTAKLLARSLGDESVRGATLFEIGDGQGTQSLDLFREAGWDHVKLARDLSDRERMIEAY